MSKLAVVLISGGIVATLGGIFIHQQLENRKSLHEAANNLYQQSQCETAIPAFINLEQSSGMLNLVDGRSTDAKTKREICSDFLSTISQANATLEKGKKQKNNNPDLALVSLNEFAKNYSNTPMIPLVQKMGHSFFMEFGAMQLATLNSCPQFDSFKKNKLIPNSNKNIPPFELGCGKTYERAHQNQVAIGYYFNNLASYPNYPLNYQAKASLLRMSEMCEHQNLDKFQNNKFISNRKYFLPTLYNNCAFSYYDINHFEQSNQYLDKFIKYYPKHTWAANAKKIKQRIAKEADSVKQNIKGTSEYLQARTIACGGGSIFASEFINFGEMLSGKDCATGEPINRGWMLLKFIPIPGADAEDWKLAKIATQLKGLSDSFSLLQRTQSMKEDLTNLSEFMNKHGEDLQLLAHHNSALQKFLDLSRKPMTLANYQNDSWTQLAIKGQN